MGVARADGEIHWRSGGAVDGQVIFARRIRVPVETPGNWEKGKRPVIGRVRALLRGIVRMPEAVPTALA